MTTNVKPEELNYDKYANEKYDDEIKNVIPGYDELHEKIVDKLRAYSKENEIKKIADLGCGTGLTSEKLMKVVPSAKLVAVDFSETMLNGARKRLSNYAVDYLLGDYAQIDFGSNFDVVVSAIGIHHQNHEGKRKLFKKIFASLAPKGIFIFGDLVTWRDPYQAAVNDAKHYAHLVQHAKNEESLREWAHHHKFLNDLAPLEDQVGWLKEAGFSNVEVKYAHLNTALIIAEK